MKNETRFEHPPKGEERDRHDQQRLRHAREQHQGFSVGRYLQPPPMLFTRDGHNVFLGDLYRGCPAFLICGGPSLTSHDLSLLSRRGVLTCSVNNAATVVKTNLWCSVDDPTHFHDVIWRDPGILKFIPLCHMEKHFIVRDELGGFQNSHEKVGDMPGVFGYRRNEDFRADQWLYEDTFNWGNNGNRTDSLGNKGSRSIMYVALRLLFYLGVRTVYLVGCDFRMTYGEQNYAFLQDRSKGSVAGNNSSYKILNARLRQLKPLFDAEGYRILNCTPNSGLTVFPHLPFEQAVEEATALLPREINTEGMYDRTANAKTVKAAPPRHEPELVNPKRPIDEKCPPGVPETTLVLDLQPGEVSQLDRSATSWWDCFPWLKDKPIVVHAGPQSARKAKRSGVWEGAMSVEFVYAQEQKPFRGLLEVFKNLETSWGLLLAPKALAVAAERRWPEAEWFSRPESTVMVGHPWGYIKPAELLARFDDWVDCLDGFPRATPRLSTLYPSRGKRVKLPTISEWFCWFKVSWLHALIEDIDAGIGNFEHQMHIVRFLHLCALRQGQQVTIANMKQHGWSHHF